MAREAKRPAVRNLKTQFGEETKRLYVICVQSTRLAAATRVGTKNACVSISLKDGPSPLFVLNRISDSMVLRCLAALPVWVFLSAHRIVRLSFVVWNVSLCISATLRMALFEGGRRDNPRFLPLVPGAPYDSFAVTGAAYSHPVFGDATTLSATADPVISFSTYVAAHLAVVDLSE